MMYKKSGYLSYFFRAKKDTVLGAVILALIIFGIHKCSSVEQDTYKARQAVYAQFETSHSIIVININSCLQKGKISKKRSLQRLEARKDLVNIIGKSLNSIPANAFFLLTQYTRFDNSDVTQNLCDLSKNQLKQILNKLDDMDIRIRNELDI